jgi:hypothetical protein
MGLCDTVCRHTHAHRARRLAAATVAGSCVRSGARRIHGTDDDRVGARTVCRVVVGARSNGDHLHVSVCTCELSTWHVVYAV